MIEDKIIVLLDMDCFYVQVEERDNPQIKGTPAAVVQYNTWKGGGIIAVNYEARAFGVKRGMRGQDAKELCPSIHLVQVPVLREKADLTKYRNAGKEVIDILCQFGDCVERASIDEAYIDFTKIIEEKLLKTESLSFKCEDLPSTWVVGYDNCDDKEIAQQCIQMKGITNWLSDSGMLDLADDFSHSSFQDRELRLAFAGVLCESMRKKILENTGFKCSAGISVNKMLAKLACGLHKPNQQTILPMKSVPLLWSSMPIGKVRNLGGKLGNSLVEDFSCKTMGDLAQLSLKQLRNHYDDKTAHWLYNLGQGIDHELVTSRQLAKSIGCSKNFNGREILDTRDKVKSWIMKLAEELGQRLLEDQKSNERLAKTLTVSIRFDENGFTRSCPLPSYSVDKISKVAFALINSSSLISEKDGKWSPAIRNVSLSAGKFEQFSCRNITKIDNMFKKIKTWKNVNNLSSSDVMKTESFGKSNNFQSEKDFPIGTASCSKDLPDSMISDTDFSGICRAITNKNSTNDDSIHLIDPSTSNYRDSTNENVQETNINLCDSSLNASEQSQGAYNNSFYGEPHKKDSYTEVCNEKNKRDKGKGGFGKRSSKSSGVKKVKDDLDKSISSQKSFFLQFLASKEPSVDNLNERNRDAENNHCVVQENEESNNLKEIDRDISNENLDFHSSQSHRTEMDSIPEPISSSSNLTTNKNFQGFDIPSTSTHSSNSNSSISVHELFPDLNNIDSSVLALLPEDVRRKIKLELQSIKGDKFDLSICNGNETQEHNSIIQEAEPGVKNQDIYKPVFRNNQLVYEICKECNRKIPLPNLLEHKDYHFAMELRKQQLEERRSALVAESAKSKKMRKGSSRKVVSKTKNLSGRSKNSLSLSSNSTTRTIDSFFKIN